MSNFGILDFLFALWKTLIQNGMNPLDTVNYSYLKMTSKATLLIIYIHLLKAIHLNCDWNLCHTMYILQCMAGDCTVFCYIFNQFPLNQLLALFLKPYTVIFNTVIVWYLQENLKPLPFDQPNTARPEYEIFL